MKSRLIHILIIFAMLLPVLPGCARKTDVFETGLNILGTFAQVSIAGLTPEQAQEATRQAEQSLESLDHIGYTFGAGGELQRVNEALANGRTIAVSSEMIDLLTRARELSLASGGLFNPAAGELTALWEFHCDREACDTPPPYPDEVQKLVEEKLAGVLKRAPSMDDLADSRQPRQQSQPPGQTRVRRCHSRPGPGPGHPEPPPGRRGQCHDRHRWQRAYHGYPR